MAKEWYLLKPPYSQISGFEDEVMDMTNDAFIEALDSPLAIDVKYCNPDLSECKDMKAIVLRNVQDTKLNAFKRHILTPIGSCKAGNYILYKNRYWLIDGLVDDNGMYDKAVMILCNWKLTWVNDSGKVVQRWSYIESASQYNNGERDNRNYTIRTDQLLIYLPYDDECFLLDTGKRFIIDKRIELYEEDLADGSKHDNSKPLITYELTRSDSVLYNYIDSGHYEILVTQDEKHNGDGYYIIDNTGYWLCADTADDIDTDTSEDGDDDTETKSAEIKYNSAVIYNGYKPTDFTAVYYDENGDETDTEAQWVINCAFERKLKITYSGNTISIAVNDYSCIDKSFELFLSGYEDETKVTIKIKALI
jgi:hypothetical protein